MIVLSGISALNLLRTLSSYEVANLRAQQSQQSHKSEIEQLAVSPPKSAEVREFFASHESTLHQPIHILVRKESDRLRQKAVVNHVCDKACFRDLICEITPHLGVVTPEYCFSQIAHELPREKALEIGMEFCGLYRLNGENERGFIAHQPLTNTEKLHAFFQQCHFLPESKSGKTLARYLLNDARSPMESTLGLLFSLPLKLGGRGFTGMRFNVPLKVPRKCQSLIKQKTIIVDLLWEKQKVAVEYDGIMDHTGADKIMNDAARRLTLEAMGYTVISLTKRQVFTWTTFCKVCDLLGMYLQKKSRTCQKDWTTKQHNLWRQLILK